MNDAVTAAVAQTVTGCGLFGMTPDGPIECSFPGYQRVPLGAATRQADTLVWAACDFTVRQPGGTPPAGWALFDADGLMVVTHERDMGMMRRRTRWTIQPTLKVKVEVT